MRIIGLAVVGPNEKYLENTLKEFKRLCDDTIIATNNADDATIALIDSYGFKHYKDDRVWGVHQPTIKTDLLTKAGKMKPDWIIALDADEVFAPEFTREEAERLASIGEVSYYFMIVNLYNDEQHFAHGKGIQRFWNIRFYKYMPEYGLQFLKKSLHCGLGPPITYNYGWHAPYYVLHYGLMDKADRERKQARYREFDPNKRYKTGDYYDELGQDLPMRPFDAQGLLAKLRETPETQARKMPRLPKHE